MLPPSTPALSLPTIPFPPAKRPMKRRDAPVYHNSPVKARNAETPLPPLEGQSVHYGSQEDDQIEPEGLMLDVVEIVLELE